MVARCGFITQAERKPLWRARSHHVQPERLAESAASPSGCSLQDSPVELVQFTDLCPNFIKFLIWMAKLIYILLHYTSHPLKHIVLVI
jgi:hypothetical protein